MPHVAKSQRHWGLKCLLRDTKFLNTCSFTIDFKKMSVYYKVFIQWWKTNHMETRACWWMVLVLVLLMNNTKCRYFQWIVLLWFLFLFFIFFRVDSARMNILPRSFGGNKFDITFTNVPHSRLIWDNHCSVWLSMNLILHLGVKHLSFMPIL